MLSDNNSTSHSIQENIIIRRQLTEALLAQKVKINEYLNLLKKEEDSITLGEFDRLDTQIQTEQTIMGGIFALQKVIEPLENLYEKAFPESEPSILDLKANIRHLKENVASSNKKNRNLLRERMDRLREEIASVRKNLSKTSVQRSSGPPALIDIST